MLERFRASPAAITSETVIAEDLTMDSLQVMDLMMELEDRFDVSIPLNLVPEIVTAVALLIFFAMIKVHTGYQGLGYLIAAHTAFCIPFAYLPIRARLENMDLSLERAAADLYASPWQTFRHVTLPLMAPGIMAGAMLAFVISLDDVVITEFVKSGGQDTLPTYMLGQLRRVITPEINAISTVFLAISVAVVTVFFLLNRKGGKS